MYIVSTLTVVHPCVNDHSQQRPASQMPLIMLIFSSDYEKSKYHYLWLLQLLGNHACHLQQKKRGGAPCHPKETTGFFFRNIK